MLTLLAMGKEHFSSYDSASVKVMMQFRAAQNIMVAGMGTHRKARGALLPPVK